MPTRGELGGRPGAGGSDGGSGGGDDAFGRRGGIPGGSGGNGAANATVEPVYVKSAEVLLHARLSSDTRTGATPASFAAGASQCSMSSLPSPTPPLA